MSDVNKDIWRWKLSEVTQPATPCEFRMVKGKPLDLELEVNRLIGEGFVLNGQTSEYVIPGTGDKIFVQSMVKYQDAEQL